MLVRMPSATLSSFFIACERFEQRARGGAVFTIDSLYQLVDRRRGGRQRAFAQLVGRVPERVAPVGGRTPPPGPVAPDGGRRRAPRARALQLLVSVVAAGGEDENQKKGQASHNRYD